MRTRTVQWIEGRILNILHKTESGKHPCSLALSSMAMNFEIRSLDEQHNFDIALYNLLKNKIVIEDRDEQGFRIYKLAA